MPHLEIDPRRCTGCRTCEQVCAFVHQGAFGPAWARIRILRRDVLTFQGRVCTHCVEALCVSACPGEALFRRGTTTFFNPDLCLGCEDCVDVCDLLFWDAKTQQPLICDLCGECPARCPEGAITIVEPG